MRTEDEHPGSGSGSGSRGCGTSAVTFSTSALDRLITDPHAVLAAEDDFWQQERAQLLTLKWGQVNGLSVSREKWREQVSAWAALPPARRAAHPLTRTYRQLMDRRNDFLAGGHPAHPLLPAP